MYDQCLSVVICSQVYEYILATFKSLSEELDVVRIAFDFHTFVSLYQSEKTSSIPSEAELTLTNRIELFIELNVFFNIEKST